MGQYQRPDRQCPDLIPARFLAGIAPEPATLAEPSRNIIFRFLDTISDRIFIFDAIDPHAVGDVIEYTFWAIDRTVVEPLMTIVPAHAMEKAGTVEVRSSVVNKTTLRVIMDRTSLSRDLKWHPDRS